MSQYKKITTQFRNLANLRKAVADLGLGSVLEVAVNPTQNTLLANGYAGAVIKSAACLRTRKVGGYEDVAFVWNGESFDAHISTHDSGPDQVAQCGNFGQSCLDRLSQRYAFHEVSAQAELQGYIVEENRESDGTIILTLTSFS